MRGYLREVGKTGLEMRMRGMIHILFAQGHASEAYEHDVEIVVEVLATREPGGIP